jgi:hypothetical protein
VICIGVKGSGIYIERSDLAPCDSMDFIHTVQCRAIVSTTRVVNLLPFQSAVLKDLVVMSWMDT